MWKLWEWLGSMIFVNAHTMLNVAAWSAKSTKGQRTIATWQVGIILPWWFLRGFWLNKILNECGLYFYPHSWIYIFMWKYSYFNIAIYLRFFTSDLLCLNVHLNYLSLDNHLVSKQPQWQCRVSMTSQWGHVTKHILNLAGWYQIWRDQNECLTIIWALYNIIY